MKLEKFLVQELSYDFANEDEWLGALTVTLRAIVRTLKLSGPATVIVPGYMLLTKNIKVPQVEKSRQQQIIAFEAQNNLPYGLHEMVWGSQIIATDGVEAEVVLFALKSDAATRFTEAVTSTGLTPTVVQAATLMDYQAYRLVERNADEEVLLVNIGARSTNLTFVSSSGFSIQNASIGGNFLTQSISDSIGKPFLAAEQLKISYFTGQLQASAGDPLLEKLQAAAQSFARRLGQDLTRRIINYKRQTQGRAPTKILLTGRASLLPGLSEQLCESQKISVDYFDPTTTLQIGRAVNTQYLEVFRFQMSEAVGEAARLVMPEPIGVNLLPGAIAESMEFSKKKPFIIAAAALFAIAPFPAAYHFFNANKALEISKRATDAEVQKYTTSQDAINKAREDAEKLSGRVAELAFVSNARDQWGNFLVELQKCVLEENPHVWIEDIKVQRGVQPPAAVVDPDGKPQPPKGPSIKVNVTIKALMDKLGPDADFDAGVVNEKFRAIRTALQKCPYVQSVQAGASDFKQANLPKQTFVLQIQPQNTL